MLNRLLTLLVLTGPVMPTTIAAQEAPSRRADDRTLSPYFQIEEGTGDLDRLPLKGTDVEVHISGVIAFVTVRQAYQNHGAEPLSARYVFPASTRAAVSGMSMRIGPRLVEAVVRERKQARRDFEQAKRAGQSVALLEEARPNVFEMGVANIMPGDRIEVELRYSELIVPTDGVYEFVYPTVVGPRYTGGTSPPGATSESWAARPYMPERVGSPSTFEINATVSAGMDIRELEVPSHDVRTDWNGHASVAVSLEESDAPQGNRDFILRYRLADDAVTSGLLLERGDEENFFVLMMEPPRRVVPHDIPPQELVFVLDVSGSMNGFPLGTAKTLLHDLVDGLRPIDSFNILLFAGGSNLLSPSSLPATAENLAVARRFFDERAAGGGTELGAALERALGLPAQGASRTFVVITDGFVTAEKDVFRKVRERLGSANVFAFGIGSSVNRYLVEGLARAGMSEPFIVTEPSEAAEVARRFGAYIASPVLTDIRIEFDGFEAFGVTPAATPDLFADRPLVVQGKWVGEADGTVTVRGTTGHGAYTQRFDLSAMSADRSEALSYLWARTRIAELSDAALSGTGDEVREEILGLGLRYNLLTRYTSFIAIDRIVRNETGATDVDQPQSMPKGVEDTALMGRPMTVGLEPRLWMLAMLTLLLVGVARRRGAAHATRRAS